MRALLCDVRYSLNPSWLPAPTTLTPMLVMYYRGHTDDYHYPPDKTPYPAFGRNPDGVEKCALMPESRTQWPDTRTRCAAPRLGTATRGPQGSA